MRSLFAILLTGPEKPPSHAVSPVSSADKQAQAQFIYNAIVDTQATIRAADVKIGILFTILSLPLTRFDSIYAFFLRLAQKTSDPYMLWILFFLTILCLSSWIFSIGVSIRAIIGIDGSIQTIKGNWPKRTFYNGNLFETNWMDSLCNRRLQCTQTLDEFRGNLPVDYESICEELSFEQIQLVRIRSLKLCRQRYAIHAAALTVFAVMGLCIFAGIVDFHF